VGSTPTRSIFYSGKIRHWFEFDFGRLSDKLITFRYDSVLLLCMSTPSSDSTLYRCEVCNEAFNSQQEIERHNKEKHVETAGQKE
jgi:predicted SprT family Zn-dependent metalloprotease